MGIYLDYNATAPMRQAAFAAACELLQNHLNPSSIHSYGRSGKAILEKSRAQIAEIIGCFPAELIFTSCGTEANNMVLRGLGDVRVAVCATEHSSVLNCVGAKIIPVDANGIINMGALDEFLRESSQQVLVSVMFANNETGVIQPIEEIAKLVHKYGGLLHSDAVQAFGKIPLDCNLLCADFLSFSSHKIGGGVGAGALFVASKHNLAPLIIGGGQEMNRRAGTENLPAIAAFASAAKEAATDSSWQSRLRNWLNEMELELMNSFAHENIIIGAGATRLPNTSLIRMPNVASQTQLMHFDINQIALSAGSACSSGRITQSHVVRAMLGEEAGHDVLRISGGWNTTHDEIKQFTKIWLKLAQKLVIN